MTWDEYNKLFHKTQANLVAFQPLMQCDHEVIRMIEAAVEAEREACAKVCESLNEDFDSLHVESCAEAIRERGQGWRGLTEDEVSEILDDVIGFNSCFGPETDFARAIEAKLKEKNT
jgi:hypothetical protein